MEIYLYRGYIEQLKVLKILIFKRQDFILIVKISFGKNIII